MTEVSDESLAYALLRLTLGVNFFGHGLVRIIGGVDSFASGMAKGFEKTILPLWLVQPFGYVLPFFELVIEVFLIVGLFSRLTLVAGADLRLLHAKQLERRRHAAFACGRVFSSLVLKTLQ